MSKMNKLLENKTLTEILFMNGFPVVKELRYNTKLYEKIYPIVQFEVEGIINILQDTEGLDFVILFGSSLSWRCHYESDIDLAIGISEGYDFYKVLKEVRTKLNSLEIREIDILIYNELDSDILKENIDKGLVIYERVIRKVT